MKKIVDHCSPSEPHYRHSGKWSYQIAIDTIAYAQNMPLRILLVRNLENLPQIINEICESDEGKELLKELDLKDEEFDKKRIMHYQKFLDNAEWLVSLSKEQKVEKVEKEKEEWLEIMLLLLPNIERRVWLTEMGNPHPAHSLTRMLDNWSLYVLMWCYLNRKIFTDKREEIDDTSEVKNNVLNIEGYRLSLGAEFSLPSYSNNMQPNNLCRLVIGPYWVVNENEDYKNNFLKKFNFFIENIQTIEKLRDDILHRVPSNQEINDAIESRILLNNEEVKIRVKSCSNSFIKYFLNVEIDDNIVLKRSDWEQLAMLCSWVARWEILLKGHYFEKNNDLWVSSDGYVGIIIKKKNNNEELILNYTKNKDFKNNEQINKLNKSFNDGKNGLYIDQPSIYWNRTQERQNAAWTSQIVAINNLLFKHTGKEGGSSTAYKNSNLALKYDYESANHLLKGFGGRICSYLLSITRAEIADIYWFDYSEEIPRLIHAGGYMQLLEHRVNRKKIHKKFDDWVMENDEECEAKKGDKSISQAYRVAYTGNEEILEKEDTQQVYFNNFEDVIRPKSSMAVPLVVNQRIIGVFTLAGLSESQFCERLKSPLHRAASLMAQSMFQSLILWQMRQLTDFFSNTPYLTLKEYDKNNSFNPLKVVSKCLANIFLCRGVNIWLKDENDQGRFILSGTNLKIFQDQNKKILIKINTNSKDLSDGEKKITEPFLSFLLDLIEKKKESSNSNSILQGRYNENIDTTIYNLKNAKYGMLLGKDFVPENTSEKDVKINHQNFRPDIFSNLKLVDLATFALIEINNENKIQVVGAVTLHDISVEGLALYTEINKKNPRPWTAAWQVVVDHVQTYLPNLLKQVEIIKKPQDNVRNFIMHEASAELKKNISLINIILNRSSILKTDGQLRKLLRKLGENDYGTYLLNKNIEEIWSAVQELEKNNSLTNLYDLIYVLDNEIEVNSLDLELIAGSTFIRMKESIDSKIKPISDELKKRGIVDELKFIDDNLVIWLKPIWWERILNNLIGNVEKYALNRFTVEWNSQKNTLSFINEATFNKDIDIAEDLVKLEYRGSAATYQRNIRNTDSGLGYGLWGTKHICNLSKIHLEIKITPLTKAILNLDGQEVAGAKYTFNLIFPPGIVTKN